MSAAGSANSHRVLRRARVRPPTYRKMRSNKGRADKYRLDHSRIKRPSLRPHNLTQIKNGWAERNRGLRGSSRPNKPSSRPNNDRLSETSSSKPSSRLRSELNNSRLPSEPNSSRLRSELNNSRRRSELNSSRLRSEPNSSRLRSELNSSRHLSEPNSSAVNCRACTVKRTAPVPRRMHRAQRHTAPHLLRDRDRVETRTPEASGSTTSCLAPGQ